MTNIDKTDLVPTDFSNVGIDVGNKTSGQIVEDLKFEDDIFTPEMIINEAVQLGETEVAPVTSILNKLLDQIEPIDFVKLSGVEDESKITKAAYRILTIEHILAMAAKNCWGLCKNHDFIYVYNGNYWSLIEPSELRAFLGKASEKMGVKWTKSRDYVFIKSLYEQFLESAYFSKPENKDSVLIPLLNGTFEIKDGHRSLRGFDKSDFLTFQLPFKYDSKATAPIFQNFLDQVLPDKNTQLVLAEFIGYLFTKDLKLEKALILFGSGANGKSVIFEVITNLLGNNSVSNFSLSSLTNESGYYRAMLANKLVNYASEINGNLEASLFKQLVSGEPVEARLPYGNPMIIEKYAKLMFNTNTLPQDVEHTNAYFRRFLIVPFDVTIKEENQDVDLANKIIKAELPGVFNWVLTGLDRLLLSRAFTESVAISNQLKLYRISSDSVAEFLVDENYRKSTHKWISLKDLFQEYRNYCRYNGYREVNSRNLGTRLRHHGIDVIRKKGGNVAFVFKGEGDVDDADDVGSTKTLYGPV
ncbi:MAG: DNA primase [Cyclobacteriaceae bacterium]|nr:DNA primase [Cyclobacteriaceae bacterium]